MLKNVGSKFQGLYESLFSLTSRQERLKFRLGESSKPVIAINDGSIVIEYSVHPGRIATWGINGGGRVIKPVVSIEVCSLPVYL